jgi:flagellar biosynthetic protein FliP
MRLYFLSQISLLVLSALLVVNLSLVPAALAQGAAETAKPSRGASGGQTARPSTAEAPVQVPKINFGVTPSNAPEDISVALQIIVLLTVLSLAPSILMMATSFTRIVIVLSFVRRALATQQLPSNQVLIGLSLILTFFVMSPTFAKINETSLQPYFNRQITQVQALEKASETLRDFMLRQTRESDLSLFIKMAQTQKFEKKSDVPFYIVMPAYIISEMKIAFEMGLIIFLPFLVIDMVVASVLMSMGMMMLPPAMISLPFKILIFVLADGWHLIIKSLVSSFV